MTNLLCSIAVLLLTNQVTHWPQKQVGTTNNPAYEQFWKQYAGSQMIPAIYISPTIPIMVDDTNADSNSVHTTVTREFWVVVPITRYWDENMKLIGEWPESRFELTNWQTMHYSVEQRRVRTNATAWVNAREIKTPDGTTYTLIADDAHARMAVTYPTNWFEPVATNDVGNAAVALALATSMTNYWVSESSLLPLTTNYIVTNLLFGAVPQTNCWGN